MNHLPIPALLYTQIIPKEVMAYKQQIKINELVTKVRIIRSVKKDSAPIMQAAEAFSCHRNTIRNILNLFEALSAEDKLRLLEASFTQEELSTLYGSLLNKSRKPVSHKRSATKGQEESIKKLFKDGLAALCWS